MTNKMSDVDIREKILECLHFIAPEIDLITLKRDRPLRDQVDIDSLDFVRFVIRLHNTLGIDIPERDYPKLTTLDSCLEYFALKLKEQEVQS